MAMTPAPAAERPTHTRYGVVGFAVVLAIITYIDRVCISQAAPAITRDLGLSKVQMGYVFFAFIVMYALFEIPSGWLGDRVGPRKVLMRIVLWWSFFTAATAWAWNFVSLFLTRLFFGAGEAGCFPNITKAFSTWLPPEERVRAQGIVWLSARWGGAFTPWLVALVFRFLTWRQAFELFGGIGVIWAIFFYAWYRDNPRNKKTMNAAELRLLHGNEKLASAHGDVPWRKLAGSRQVWLLCAQYFCLSYGWYFYITWLPTYLDEVRHLDLAHGSVLAGVPLFLGGLGSLFSGFVSAPLTRLTGSVRTTRRLLACTGFTGACGLLILSTHLREPLWAMLAMGFASFCNDLVMPGSWGSCMDIGGRYAGTVSGAMNMMGNLGGAAQPVVASYLVRLTHNWDLTFYVSAAVYFCGSFFWLALDPVTPIEGAAPQP